VIPSTAMLADTITDPTVEPGRWLRNWWIADPDDIPHGDLHQQAAAERAARRERETQ